MIEITLKFGISNSVTRGYKAPVTLRSILSDASVRAALQCGENVTAIDNGVTISIDAQITSSKVIRLETAAASKA